MSGQGSPTTTAAAKANRSRRPNPPRWPRRTARRARRLRAAALSLMLINCLVTCTDAVAQTQSASPSELTDTIDLRLRISLGGGASRQWTGNISIVEATAAFSDLAPLGLHQNANAAITLGKTGRIEIDHHADTDYNAIDVTVRGDPTAKLRIDLTPSDQPDLIVQYDVTLRELIASGDHRDIDAQGNRCSIDRVPSDAVRLEIDRPHLIFDPNEEIDFDLTLNRSPLSSASCQCRVAITPARRPKNPLTPWNHSTNVSCDASGSANPWSVTLAAPRREGVYDLLIEVQPNGFAPGLGQFTKQPKVTRKVQFVVLAKTAPDNVSKKAWKSLASFSPQQLMDASDSTWPQHLTASLNQLTQGKRRRPGTQRMIGNQRRKIVASPEGTVLQLAPGGWQAIAINGPVDRPCLIEVDCNIREETALGVSLLQPDDAGQVSSLPQDSGVIAERSLVKRDEPTIQTYRIYHWPKEQDAWLVLANRHSKQNAEIAEVRVLTGPDRLAADRSSKLTDLPFHPTDPPFNLTDPPPKQAKPLLRRQAMAFFEAPTFPEKFGASEHLDPLIGQPLDDWVTFYEGADRFIQYLKSQHLAGAFVTVACDGSGLYPSRLLRPSPRYDNGAFLSDGNDPIRKDVVELLFRMFEREQLTLVPVVAMNGAMAGLSESRENELIDFNGRLAGHEHTERLPRYNPLSPNVQSAVTNVVGELANRYRHHDSFDGVAIACRPDTVTLLPGQQWACDLSTMERFVRSAKLPDAAELAGQDQATLINTLLSRHRDRWLTWRANDMTGLYQRLRSVVRDALPGATLYLAPVNAYQNAEVAASLMPSLHGSKNFNRAMLRLGFDESWSQPIHQRNGIVLLNPHRIASGQPLASRRVDQHVNSLDQATKFFDAAVTGDLLAHRGDWVHFAQLQDQPVFDGQRGALMRRQQLLGIGSEDRRNMVQRIRNTDSQLIVDSSWVTPMDRRSSMADLIQIYAQLPAVEFEDLPAVAQTQATATRLTSSMQGVHSTQAAQSTDSGEEAETSEGLTDSLPVVVRQVTVGGESWFYAANASPWPVRVRCDTAITNGKPFEPLPGCEFEASDEKNRTGDSIEFTMLPWSLVGGRSQTSQSRLTCYSVELPQDADIGLKKEIYRLQSLLVQSTETQPLDGLANPGFENPSATVGNGSIAGWTSSQTDAEAVTFELNPTDAHLGQQSATLTNNGPAVAWVRSNEFAAPETGRLSVSAWLKTGQGNQSLPLRISLEGKSGSSDYYRFGAIGSLSPDPELNQIGPQWRRFAVHFDDLPLENFERLRIGFDLMGPGQVAIDQVEIYDRWFDENDSKAINQLLASARTLLETPSTYDRCRRSLESYWPRFLSEHFDDLRSEVTSKTGESAPPVNQATEEPRNRPIAEDRAAMREGRGVKQGMLRFRNVFGPRQSERR